MGSRMSAAAALVNAKWYAQSRSWVMSDDDLRYLILLTKEVADA